MVWVFLTSSIERFREADGIPLQTRDACSAEAGHEVVGDEDCKIGVVLNPGPRRRRPGGGGEDVLALVDLGAVGDAPLLD